MDFGQISPHSGIDFSVGPHFDARHEKPQQSIKTRVYLGAPTWNEKGWYGKIYPAGSTSKNHLHHYAQTFGTVELNATFYKTPSQKTIQQWMDQTPKDFRFVVKAPKALSHGELTLKSSEFTQWIDSLKIFQPKLAMTFLQLPPHFSWDDRSRLVRFTRAFPKEFKLGIEFRHPSWFSFRQFDTKAACWFAEQDTSLVITDTPGRRDVSHGTISNSTVLVRFLGSQLHPTDYTRLDAWVERLKEWSDISVKTIYFIIHQPDQMDCPELISYLAKELDSTGKFELRYHEPMHFPLATPPTNQLFNLNRG